MPPDPLEEEHACSECASRTVRPVYSPVAILSPPNFLHLPPPLSYVLYHSFYATTMHTRAYYYKQEYKYDSYLRIVTIYICTVLIVRAYEVLGFSYISYFAP